MKIKKAEIIYKFFLLLLHSTVQVKWQTENILYLSICIILYRIIDISHDILNHSNGKRKMIPFPLSLCRNNTTQIFTRQKSFRLHAFNNKMKKAEHSFVFRFILKRKMFYVNVHEFQAHINKFGLVQLQQYTYFKVIRRENAMKYVNEPLQNQLMAKRSKTRENRVQMLRKIDIVFLAKQRFCCCLYVIKYFFSASH